MTILGRENILSWFAVVCVGIAERGGGESPFDSLQGGLSIVVFCIDVFWHLLVIAKECERYFVWLAELFWKKFVGYLGYGSP